MSEQFSLDGMSATDKQMVDLRAKEFERKFGDYWSNHNTAWGPERIQRTVIGIAKELMVVAQDVKANPAHVGALRAAGDLLMRMLNKHIPDLKAIEMTGNVGVSHEDALAQLEFAVRTQEQAAERLSAVRGDVPENPH